MPVPVSRDGFDEAEASAIGGLGGEEEWAGVETFVSWFALGC